MIIPISNDILDNFELKNHDFLVDNQYYDLVSGQQEYRLYSYLSTFFDGITILDIGTLSGRSAISLSHNENNQVISYDITNNIHDDTHKIYSKSNITFHVKNVLDDLNEELAQHTKIVMIDIDHRGNCELDIICRLKELNFSGIIILDDTTNHPDGEIKECMKQLWDDIHDIKYDFTQYGHFSGTGIINMNYDISFSFS